MIRFTILQLTKVTLIYTIFSTIYRNKSPTRQRQTQIKRVHAIREIQPFEPEMDTIGASHHFNTTVHAARKSYMIRRNMHVCHGIRRSEIDNIRETCQQNGWKYVDPFDAQNRDEFLLLHRQNKHRLGQNLRNREKRKRKNDNRGPDTPHSAKTKKTKDISDEDIRSVQEECILFDCIFNDPAFCKSNKTKKQAHNSNKQRLARRKKTFDGCSHVPHPPIDFSNFHSQPLPTRQKLDTFYRAECRMYRLQHMFCPNCHQRRLAPTEKIEKASRSGCIHCDSCKDNMIKYSHLNKAIPIWKDTLTGTIHYHVPEELQDLTLGEKMLIQKASPVVPLVHIKNGIFGIKGHVCALPQHIESICTELPRKTCRIVKVIKSGMAKDGTIHTKQFKIRKKKVLAALNWLKGHSNAYKDIKIIEKNLDWMGDAAEANIRDVVELDSHFTDTDNVDKGPAPKQVFPDGNIDDMEYDATSGIMSDNNATIASGVDLDVLDQLKQTCMSNFEVHDHINWPRIDTEAIDEKQEKIFCMAFPWLFPGGVGDINDLRDIPLTPKEWAKNLIFHGDGRFQKDEFFPFYALDFITR